jgi:hypothetical protein
MKNTLIFLLILCFSNLKGQENNHSPFSITPEIIFGVTNDSNTNFPRTKLQKQAIISFGWHNKKETQEWTSYIKNTKTGFSIGYTDLGNKSQLGEVFTLQPFLEFNAFRSEDLNVHIGSGVSYMTKKYNPISNEFNKAVSTDFTWSFRLFMYYDFIKSKEINWRVGTGFTHHSNGHSKLPNQGYNSLLISLGAEIEPSKKKLSISEPLDKREKTVSNYYSIRSGLGLNVLSTAFDKKEEVYTISGEYGRIYNNTFKIGFGSYVRFYQNYYNYISNNESLVQDGREFSDLKSNAFLNSLNIGITANGELLLNHVGIDLQIGINLYKPAYKIDWRINQGWGDVPKIIVEDPIYYRLGDVEESYFKVKRTVSARFGLKYYLKGTTEKTSNNFYIGAFINSNLGQADFTEFAFGYVKNFKSKSKKQVR